MSYLLDSDTVNFALRNTQSVSSKLALAGEAGIGFFLCPIVDFEVTRYLYLKGASQGLRLYERLVRSWERTDFVPADWSVALDLWVERYRNGRPIADADLLIDVMARRLGATLVTNNTRHFEDLGLSLENWLG